MNTIHRHADSTVDVSNFGSDSVIAQSRIVRAGPLHWVLYRVPGSYKWRVLSRSNTSFNEAQILLINNWIRHDLHENRRHG